MLHSASSCSKSCSFVTKTIDVCYWLQPTTRKWTCFIISIVFVVLSFAVCTSNSIAEICAGIIRPFSVRRRQEITMPCALAFDTWQIINYFENIFTPNILCLLAFTFARSFELCLGMCTMFTNACLMASILRCLCVCVCVCQDVMYKNPLKVKVIDLWLLASITSLSPPPPSSSLSKIVVVCFQTIQNVLAFSIFRWHSFWECDEKVFNSFSIEYNDNGDDSNNVDGSKAISRSFAIKFQE